MKSRSEALVAYLMLIPALLALAIFRIYPIAVTCWGGLCTESFVVAGKLIFVGLANYLDLFQDPIFWKSVWVTLKLNIVINPLQVCLACFLPLWRISDSGESVSIDCSFSFR